MGLSETRELSVLNDIATDGVYVALHSADEGNDPDGTNELTATDYDRQFVAEADIDVSGGGPSTLTVTTEVEFVAATAVDWGDVTHGSLWEDQVDGDPISATESLTNGGDTPSGIRVFIPENDLTVTID